VKKGTAMNILVIDDEQVIHESIRKPLSREGYHVDAVFSAREGLEHMARTSYDLVITDLMMPEIDGLEFLRELRKASMDVPTIMITGYPTIRTAVQALRQGAADYLPKPFTRKELLSPVRRILRRRAGMQDGAAGRRSLLDLLDEAEEDGARPAAPARPGDRYCLPEHSWAVYQQDGRVAVGVEAAFLRSAGKVVRLELPVENDLVEQGFPGMKLVTESEEHNLFLPVSGCVVAVNQQLLEAPAGLTPDQWLLYVLPSQLQEDIVYLKRIDSGAKDRSVSRPGGTAGR